MHVTTKDQSQSGKVHTLTTVIEADGPFELVTAGQKLSGEVVALRRTASGGIEAVTNIYIDRPEPAAADEGATD